VASEDVAWLGRLREGLRLASVAGSIATPGPSSRLLELIVATAARVIHATKGSLFLVDEATGELVFEVALDEPIEQLKRLRLAPGRGIAGMVALTGQAMAISDVASDPRHASEIAELTGYAPRNLVCVPLAYADRVIGVIELMDKVSDSGFTAADIDTLSLFASQAAITIDQSRTMRDLAGLLTETVVGSAGLSSNQAGELLGRTRQLVTNLERDPRHTQALQLARDVQEIVEYGELESHACQVLLHGFLEYLRARPRAASEKIPPI
jgi:GAF domain-containing protein